MAGTNIVCSQPELLVMPPCEPPQGVVRLDQKARPLFELAGKGGINGLPVCCTRGRVCVEGFKRKLREDGDRYWQADEASRSNVSLVRPSHDAWGIKKIVFIYCDDYLMRCYELPWLHDSDWKDLLMPVFEALGVPLRKVVRCLLASMPPGSAIPPHHDTGHWVQHTHRIHVPIITSPQHVIFRAGVTVDTMRRWDLTEGAIVELNNQAKHAVDSCWDRDRVHLILDYVEDYAIERILLKPGQRVYQTRRSIDLDSAKGTTPCPSYLILGAQKCGTTSMYEYLCQHPLVFRARRRETHYLDWRWRKDCKSSREHLDTYHKFFHKKQLEENPTCITGESTPSYLLHSDIVIPRVKALAPDAKLIVMLRDPVARAYSQYQMVIDPEGTPEQKAARGTKWIGKTFEQLVEEELRELEGHGVTPGCSYERFKEGFLASRPLGHGSHSMLARGLYALQLQPWLAAFPREQLLILFMEDMRTPEQTQRLVSKVYNFVGLPDHVVVDTEPKNSRKYEPLSDVMREKLAAFYERYNRQLFDLLGMESRPWCSPARCDAESA